MVCAKRKRQDKQTVNQRREDNAMAKRQDKQTETLHCLLFFDLVCLSCLLDIALSSPL
jgi:hypothetical protein